MSRKDDQMPSDPIIDQCVSFTQEFQITLAEKEWSNILSERDNLEESPLGGAYVHKDVLYVLCFLCLFDGLFEAGVDLLRTGDNHQAGNSLEKAKKLLPWPTVLYSLGFGYARLGDTESATRFWNEALESFEARISLLSVIVPSSFPDRDNFIAMTAKRIDTTSSLLLDFPSIVELKDKISKGSMN
ncbi:MAG: hypothetical protein GY721_03310 [Deltaproteobacteria bacterium]|nr:hypothetical protein [Deltaproteobacteria bacterium]